MRWHAMALSIPLAMTCAPVAEAGPMEHVAMPHVAATTPVKTCVETTVRSVTPRLTSGAANERYTHQDFVDSGVDVVFNTKIGEPSGRFWAEVVHYGGMPGDAVMMNEHAGNRVRVCFLGGPHPDRACDPSTDFRGRTFSVYDYRQHASYSGMNSEHDCGGA